LATGAQLQAEVAQSIENLQTTDPMYPYILGDATHPSLLTQAANKLIITAIGGNNYVAGLFPELEDISDFGPSTAGSNVIPRPSDAILVYEMTSARSGTSPDWNISREWPVTYVQPLHFGYLTKDTTVTGYARLWTRIGDNVKLWPTPSSAYLDYFRRYYLKQEPTLTAGASLLMNARWNDLVVKMTAAMVLEKMKRYDDSKVLMESAVNEIKMSVNLTAAEAHPRAIPVANAPTRSMVYGR
jgi:hypothetical protein